MSNFLPRGLDSQYIVYPTGKIYSKQQSVWNGKVYFLKDGRYLKQTIGANGYKTVGITKNGINKNVYVHRLLAEAYIPNPNNRRTVNHKDGNKLNNQLDNLEWATYAENNKHAFKIGLSKGIKRFGIKNKQAKITNEQVEQIRSLKGRKILKDVAKSFNLSISQVWSIQNKVSWSHIK